MQKPAVLTTVIALILLTYPCYSQTFQWAKQYGGNIGESRSAAVDDLGNVYTAGYFGGTVDFDPGAGAFNLTPNGATDIFITKQDDLGNLVWAKQLGASEDDLALAIALDAAGNVYATGQFGGTVDFDPGVGTFNLTSASGATNVFIVKLDAGGNFAWAKQFEGNAASYGYALTIDASGNIYTAGYLQYTADFDPGPNSFLLTATGIGGDIFVSKLDASGNFVWAKQMGGSSSVTTSIDIAYSISIDESGNVYTTGIFENTADFDPGANTFNLTTAGGYDVFVSKLNSDGNFVWVKQFGGSSNEFGRAIATGVNGVVYLTGHFEGEADFDPSPSILHLTSKGENDIFTIRLNASGDLVWVKQQGGINNDYGYAISVDPSLNVYTTGYFYGTSDFDPGSGIFNLSATGSADVFVSKLNHYGNLMWATNAGGGLNEFGYAIDVIGRDITVVGPFSGTADFDPGVGTHTLTSLGSIDMFSLRLTQCANKSSTHTVSACGSYTWIDGHLYTSSNSTATVLLFTKAGCDSLVTLNLTIKVVDNSVTATSSTLTANVNAASYKWLNCSNGEYIVNATGQSFSPTLSGNYGVEILSNGCKVTSTCIPMVITGLDERTKFDLQVYPNPTAGNIKLSIPEHLEVAEVRLLNIQGQTLLHRKSCDAQIIDLNIEGGSGLYFVAIRTRDGKSALVKVFKN